MDDLFICLFAPKRGQNSMQVCALYADLHQRTFCLERKSIAQREKVHLVGPSVSGADLQKLDHDRGNESLR